MGRVGGRSSTMDRTRSCNTLAATSGLGVWVDACDCVHVSVCVCVCAYACECVSVCVHVSVCEHRCMVG